MEVELWYVPLLVRISGVEEDVATVNTQTAAFHAD